MNLHLVSGYIQNDPELNHTTSGTPVTSLILTSRRHWVNSDGQKTIQKDYHNLVFWGGKAEVVDKYVKQGMFMVAYGHVECNKWQTEEGEHRSKNVVVVQEFEFHFIDNS